MNTCVMLVVSYTICLLVQCTKFVTIAKCSFTVFLGNKHRGVYKVNIQCGNYF